MSKNKVVKNLFYDLDLNVKSSQDLWAVVEIEKGGKNKYEYDKKRELFRVDRVLYGSVYYPTDYGFLPQTWSEREKDPLDVMVVCTNPTHTGCVMEVRPVGVFKMRDRGIDDHKIIAIMRRDPRFAHVKTVDDLGPHFKIEIKDFWENYAKLQPTKTVEILGWGSGKEARKVIMDSHKVFERVFGK